MRTGPRPEQRAGGTVEHGALRGTVHRRTGPPGDALVQRLERPGRRVFSTEGLGHQAPELRHRNAAVPGVGDDHADAVVAQRDHVRPYRTRRLVRVGGSDRGQGDPAAPGQREPAVRARRWHVAHHTPPEPAALQFRQRVAAPSTRGPTEATTACASVLRESRGDDHAAPRRPLVDGTHIRPRDPVRTPPRAGTFAPTGARVDQTGFCCDEFGTAALFAGWPKLSRATITSGKARQNIIRGYCHAADGRDLGRYPQWTSS